MKRWVLINSKVLPTSITRSLVYETRRERKQNRRKKNKNADNVGRNQTIVAKNQSNEHETAQIVLVPDKLQNAHVLGRSIRPWMAGKYTQPNVRIPSIPCKPRVCLTPPFALTSL
jgi:hypothetical protein